MMRCCGGLEKNRVPGRQVTPGRQTGINKEKDSQGDEQLPGEGKGKEKKKRIGELTIL